MYKLSNSHNLNGYDSTADMPAVWPAGSLSTLIDTSEPGLSANDAGFLGFNDVAACRFDLDATIPDSERYLVGMNAANKVKLLRYQGQLTSTIPIPPRVYTLTSDVIGRTVGGFGACFMYLDNSAGQHIYCASNGGSGIREILMDTVVFTGSNTGTVSTYLIGVASPVVSISDGFNCLTALSPFPT